MMPIQVSSGPQIRAFPKINPIREQMRQLQLQGPPVTVFVGKEITFLSIFKLYLNIFIIF